MDKNTKKVFSKIGFALLAAMIASSFIQVIILGVSQILAPSLVESGWISYIGIGVGFYLIGFPLFKLIVRKLLDGEIRETKKLSIKEILGLFLICYFLMIVTNLATTLLLNGVSIIKGNGVDNPLANLVANSNVFGTLIFAGILSPIVEELLFRGVMLNKLRMYGDKVAILTTALCFGLFHGNFSQFFYATLLGMVFAYVTLKTGTIKYSIILHIMVNIMGSVIGPLAASNQIYTAILGLFIIVFVISGLVLFIKNIKRINILSGEIILEKGQAFKTTCLNAGMIIYFLFMFINMAALLLL